MYNQMAMSSRTAPARQVSMATARNSLPSLVKAAEAGHPVEITRRGRSVAVLLSSREYERLAASGQGLWDAICAFRSSHELRDDDVEAIFAGVRDRSPGRDEGQSGL
jgi:prevent-host-death family protein